MRACAIPVLLALAMTVATGAMPASAPSSAPTTQAAGAARAASTRLEGEKRLMLLYLVLATTAAGLLAFVVISYVLMRILRRALPAKRSQRPSVYVDAWANYRLTPEQIDRATREPDDGEAPGPKPGAG